MPAKHPNLMSLLIFFFFFFFFVSPSLSALLAPITKDDWSNEYTVSVYLKTPPQPTKLVLHLGASFSWADCTPKYSSTTFHSLPCNSSLCLSRTCSNNTCLLFPQNPLSRRGKPIVAKALVDSLALPTTDGHNPAQLGRVPEFVFSCSRTSLLKGRVRGLAGLGRSSLSLPAQISTAFSSPFLFALCLSGSPSAPGVAFFNTGGPYFFLPEIDLSKSLIYTPLLLISDATKAYLRRSDDEYFIGVTKINVNGKAVQFNQTISGTMISTVDPYTVLQTSILNAFTELFVNESAALNLTITEPVKPFSVCYLADDVLSTQVGPAVPTVDLVMQSDDVFWRIFGSNSMVRILRKDVDVWCLGFVDGGDHPRASIVIGGHQIEDNLLQFDLGLKRLGFTSSVLVHNTTCANFNFTATTLK